VEHGSDHANDIAHHQWLVFGGGFREWMQQHVCGPGGDGEPLAVVHRFRIGTLDIVPRKQRDSVRARRLQLFVEQR